MRSRTVSVIVGLILLQASAAVPQTPPAPATRPPDFSVQIWGDAVADFNARVRAYFELRTRLEVGVPPLVVTPNPADIQVAEFALAQRLREARAGAREGNIFSGDISAAFRAAIRPALDEETVTTILDENPGSFRHRVDGMYPKERSVSTVPANVLAILPELPADIQYRFLGRHLVLHDIRANVILDRMTCAVPCH